MKKPPERDAWGLVFFGAGWWVLPVPHIFRCLF